MSDGERRQKRLVEREAARCARLVFYEITGGVLRPEGWYIWFLCERHGGPPLIDPHMSARQIAYWDGEDIMVAARAPLADIVAALPEELAHRLTSRETPRFEWLNDALQHAHCVERTVFQEMVGQQVALLFAQHRWASTKGG